MPIYHTLGKIPHKRHTVFKKDNGSLYFEQLFGTQGFSGVSSLLYHCNPPTRVKEILTSYDVTPNIAIEKNLKSYSLKTFQVQPEDDYLKSRVTLFVNNDLHLGVAAPKSSLKEYFYKNADADEMLFIHKGDGELKTLMGNISFSEGDYLIIPRGIIYQITFNSVNNRLLYMESFSPIETPKRYRNNFGQLLEHSPFCERDIRRPQLLETHDMQGEFRVKIKKEGIIYEYVYGHHPFDIVGWDGFNYPWAFSIYDFEPITGRVHQPPPVHQTFEGYNYVVCSFCPRLYDYHPDAIPAPYAHSNIDSDEVLYYVAGEFMSRKHVEEGMISLHPGGIPHGPHPGTIEKSIGQKKTNELAVMIDPFRPLKLTEEAMKIADKNYYTSWME